MALMRVKMDGTTYRVRIIYDTLARAAELIEGDNRGDMLSGRYERDLSGTKYNYSVAVEPDPRYPADYDSFYHAITDPAKDSHTITMPYGQTTLTYEAMVQTAKDTFAGVLGGVNQWKGLVVEFKAISVQRTPS